MNKPKKTLVFTFFPEDGSKVMTGQGHSCCDRCFDTLYTITLAVTDNTKIYAVLCEVQERRGKGSLCTMSLPIRSNG